jgi:hypothetical protein
MTLWKSSRKTASRAFTRSFIIPTPPPRLSETFGAATPIPIGNISGAGYLRRPASPPSDAMRPALGRAPRIPWRGDKDRAKSRARLAGPCPACAGEGFPSALHVEAIAFRFRKRPARAAGLSCALSINFSNLTFDNKYGTAYVLSRRAGLGFLFAFLGRFLPQLGRRQQRRRFFFRPTPF